MTIPYKHTNIIYSTGVSTFEINIHFLAQSNNILLQFNEQPNINVIAEYFTTDIQNARDMPIKQIQQNGKNPLKLS